MARPVLTVLAVMAVLLRQGERRDSVEGGEGGNHILEEFSTLSLGLWESG